MNVLDATTEIARVTSAAENSVKLAVEKINAARTLNIEQQKTYTRLQSFWHVHERIDDHLLDALSALGD